MIVHLPACLLDGIDAALSGMLRLLEGLWSSVSPLPARVGVDPPFADLYLCRDPRGDGEKVLFNTGGPRSRKRSERIQATLFDSAGASSHRLGTRRVGQVWAIENDREALLRDRPSEPRKQSLRETALQVLHELGFTSEDEAFDRMKGIPPAPLHARTLKRAEQASGAACSWKDPAAFLLTALVLGKCRNGLYDPGRPVIWTEKRLEQWLELHEIRASFYLWEK